jgi:hypothetical protein
MICSSVNIGSVMSNLDLECATNVDISSYIGEGEGVPTKSKKYEVISNHQFLMVVHRRTTCQTFRGLDEKCKLMNSTTAIGIEAF